ncbi:MAG: hypothetical protein NTU58_03325 [Candidatus Nealsonbacteria bacterium]|nr:hypothetical protein [Candidatus Nealsonbacteria bacterium]
MPTIQIEVIMILWGLGIYLLGATITFLFLCLRARKNKQRINEERLEIIFFNTIVWPLVLYYQIKKRLFPDKTKKGSL